MVCRAALSLMFGLAAEAKAAFTLWATVGEEPNAKIYFLEFLFTCFHSHLWRECKPMISTSLISAQDSSISIYNHRAIKL